MRDPSNPKFVKTQGLMRSGLMLGMDRPTTRVTFAKQKIRSLRSNKKGLGTVRYLPKNPTNEHEFHGVRTVEIQRSIGQDAATCTIVLWNTHVVHLEPQGIDTEGRRGYKTPGRGDAVPAHTSVYDGYVNDFAPSDFDPMSTATSKAVFPTSWGYPTNIFRDVFIPNTVIRTYQGYGSDNYDQMGNEIFTHDPGSANYVEPSSDSQLYLTGTWLIDKVTVDATSDTITLECRDLAKFLIEQYIYPPLLPIERFPLIYCPAHKNLGHKEVIGKNVARYHSASTDRVFGKDGKVLGHRGKDAFDKHSYTFWLSGANNVGSAIEWLQASVHGPVNEVTLHTYKGNYLVYVSVHEHGKWQGTHTLIGSSENLSASESSGDGNGSGGFIYVIATGDTLWDLAGKYYGDNFKWPIIAKANNNIKDPHWIFPGQRIKIPYVKGTKNPPPNGYNGTGGTHVDIPTVISATVPNTGKVTITLPRTYHANFVRVSFTNLDPINLGPGDPYRVGVRKMEVRNHIPNTFQPSTEGVGGNINDWTEPVKEMCAWAGLTWEDATPNPADPVIGSTVTSEDGELRQLNTAVTQFTHELALPLSAGKRASVRTKLAKVKARLATIKSIAGSERKPLRVWGDFEILGAGPVVCTPGDYFMNKSFMDGIGLIRDFIGCIFFVDESGGAQFRLPNIWSSGNFIDDTDALSTLGARTSAHPIELHEDVNLLAYQLVLSDESVRSEVLVVGGYKGRKQAASPVAGGYVLGYNPDTHETSAIDFTDVLAGQYRIMIVPGDNTKLFYSAIECQRMAELTALFILFTYRTATASIPAHPGLQIDDQVRVFERSTYETNIHYVAGISSSHDLEGGQWKMDLTLHWLGGNPNTDWFVNKNTLTPAVTDLPAILKRVGKQAAGGVFEQPVYGT